MTDKMKQLKQELDIETDRHNEAIALNGINSPLTLYEFYDLSDALKKYIGEKSDVLRNDTAVHNAFIRLNAAAERFFDGKGRT